MTYIESGFGHISSMDSIYGELLQDYGDEYDIQKSYIMREDGFPHLMRLERFFAKQVENTNKIPGFGKFIFFFIQLLGSHKIMRFVHRQLAIKSFREGLEAFKRRKPDVIVTNHYFTNMLAVEYKHRIDPDVVIINYNPDCTMHSIWDKRDGVFIVNCKRALDKALKFKFKPENLRTVNPCVRKCVEQNTKTRAELREKYGLPQDKFTVTIADGGYMFGRGPKFARKLIKKGLPITLCIIAGNNEKRYNEFSAIAEGKSKLKLKDGMTLKVYRFLPEAYELYGASDVFLTKGGPNAVLDSIYMHTPVMINYTPHVIEEATVDVYIDELACGETAFKPKTAIKRIEHFMADNSDLVKYGENIDKFLAVGNGAAAVAEIIVAESKKRGAVGGDESDTPSDKRDAAFADELSDSVVIGGEPTVEPDTSDETECADAADGSIRIHDESERSEQLLQR